MGVRMSICVGVRPRICIGMCTCIGKGVHKSVVMGQSAYLSQLNAMGFELLKGRMKEGCTDRLYATMRKVPVWSERLLEMARFKTLVSTLLLARPYRPLVPDKPLMVP